MSKLIDDLEQDHIDLTTMLNKIIVTGIEKKESKETLFKTKKILLDHLKKEDEKLYPILNNSKDKETRKIVKSFILEMEEITKVANKFFEKYQETNESEEFDNDINLLLAALANRIDKEETVLFPRYEIEIK